jgi:prophage regulatory protein
MLEKLLRLSEVRNRVPYSRATIYRLISSGEFPRPYSLGARAVAWRETEISAWIEDKIAKHDKARPAPPRAMPEVR